MSLRSTPSQRSICSPIEIHKTPDLDASSCPILNVVVYPDKAEVTRKVNVQVKEGLTQIKITNVSRCVEPATIRVLTLSNSILNEVNFATKTAIDEGGQGVKKLVELKQQQAEMLKELSHLEVKENTLRKQKEVLEAFANRIISCKKTSEEESLEALSLSSLDMISKFLPLYEENSAKVTDGLSEIKEQRAMLDKRLKELNQDINSTDPTKDGILSREIHILTEAYEEEEVKLLVSYVVGEAGWSPKYDLRVHSRDKNLKVLYFGVVSQNTGEPWTDARISLSTATPSTGGLPMMGTHELYSRAQTPLTPSLKRAHRGTSVRRKKSEKNIKLPPSADCIEEDAATDISKLTVNGLEGGASEENLTTTVDFEDITEPVNKIMAISTTYATAAEDVTIPSDKSGHKVHIAKIDLPAAFYYASCPRVCPHAFLHITARNDSAYALLAGPADIFLDGNFCRKTTMRDVCPTEDFEVDVGSDPTIKVIYRPLLRHKDTGSKTHIISYTQDMDLKNGRRDGPINIAVTDQLPKSTDDKVKVILHEPDIKKKKETSARLNAHNNIEWNIEIPPDSTAKLHLRYSVEYPLHVDVIGLV